MNVHVLVSNTGSTAQTFPMASAHAALRLVAWMPQAPLSPVVELRWTDVPPDRSVDGPNGDDRLELSCGATGFSPSATP